MASGLKFDPQTARHADELRRVLDGYPLPELAGKNLFITGGSGFLGYWLLLAFAVLNERGHDIRATLLSRNPFRFAHRYPALARQPGVAWIAGDVRHYEPPMACFDAFIHAATDTSPEAASRPLELFEVMFDGTRHVLDHALACGVRRIVVVSSGAVYGTPPDMPTGIAEDAPYGGNPTDVLDVYGEGKRAMEMLATCYRHAHGIEPVFARAFALIGHGLPKHLAISQFIQTAQQGRDIVIEGDGQAIRSYLYGADMAVWLLALLVRGRPGRAYNIGSDQAISLADLAKMITRLQSSSLNVNILATRPTVKRLRYVPDITRARTDLGLEVWTGLQDAIKAYLTDGAARSEAFDNVRPNSVPPFE